MRDQAIDTNGYYRFIRGVHGNRLVHRCVWEAAFGKLPDGWIVHHCNKVKTDNRLENLVGLPDGYHDQIHAREKSWGLPRREDLVDAYRSLRARYDVAIEARERVAAELAELDQELANIGCTAYGQRNMRKKHKGGKRPLGTIRPRSKKKDKKRCLPVVGQREHDVARMREIKELRKGKKRRPCADTGGFDAVLARKRAEDQQARDRVVNEEQAKLGRVIRRVGGDVVD